MSAGVDLVSLARLAPSGLALLAADYDVQYPPHLAYLEKKLLEVASGECKRLIVSMPPGHAKSSSVSHYFVAWYLGLHPSHRVQLVTYESDFAASWGRKARDLVERHGRGVFGISVDQTSKAADRWDLRGRSGGMQTTGVGGPLTGKRANVLVIDDPIKNAQEALSQAVRESIWNWFTSTAYTRLEPEGALVIVMTRWHEDDLAGRLIAQMQQGGEAWEVISFPALAEEGDVLGRPVGEALWPERFTKARLEAIRSVVGSYVWSALYQQRPVPMGGGLFKREWIKRYEAQGPLGFEGTVTARTPDRGLTKGYAVRDLTRYATVDLAVSLKEEADRTVVAVFGKAEDGTVFLLDVVAKRLEGPDVTRLVREVALDRWKCSAVWIERVGYQLAIVQQARREGLPVRELLPDKDKVARALPATAALEAGRILLPERAAWLSDFEHELLSFPKGAHDDQVDAFSYGVLVAQDSLGEFPTLSYAPKADEWAGFAPGEGVRDEPW